MGTRIPKSPTNGLARKSDTLIFDRVDGVSARVYVKAETIADAYAILRRHCYKDAPVKTMYRYVGACYPDLTRALP